MLYVDLPWAVVSNKPRLKCLLTECLLVSSTGNNPCASGANNCQANNFQTCVFDDEGLFHCEDCLPGYRHEGNECTTDPCQLHQDNCNERNFDRCLFTTGGGFTCSLCKAGYNQQGAECIRDGELITIATSKCFRLGISCELVSLLMWTFQWIFCNLW